MINDLSFPSKEPSWKFMPTRRRASFSGTMVASEVNADGATSKYDPCGDEQIAVSPNQTRNTVTMSAGSGGGGDGTFTMQTPIPKEDQDEGLSSISLRPVSGGIEIRGCNNGQLSDEGFEEDSFYIERESDSWEMSRIPFQVTGHASCVHGDNIYFFGGSDQAWNTSNKFYSYNVKTKGLVELNNGGLTARSNAFAWCDGTHFYLYAGFEYGLWTDSFLYTFHRYHFHSQGWEVLTVPNKKAYSKLIGGAGKLYLANVGESIGSGFDITNETWAYSIGGNTWDMPDSGFDVTDEYHNFNTYVLHQDVIYYYASEKISKILPYQNKRTEGVELPSFSHNASMVSWGEYILFGNGFTDGVTSSITSISWYNTSEKLFGTLATVGDIPQAIIGFHLHVIDDVLYMIGGTKENNIVTDEVWSLRLNDFFRTMPENCPSNVKADTFREKVGYACKVYEGHPCPQR